MRPNTSLAKSCLILVCLGVPVAIGAWIQHALDQTLLAPTFLTGWCFAVLLALGAWGWFHGITTPADLHKRIKGQMWLGAVMLILFLVHTQLRLPQGWMERALSVGFEVLIAGLIIGALIASDAKTSTAGLRRWLRFHVAVHWGLLSVALFHGVFTHIHCALAHYLFYSE